MRRLSASKTILPFPLSSCATQLLALSDTFSSFQRHRGPRYHPCQRLKRLSSADIELCTVPMWTPCVALLICHGPRHLPECNDSLNNHQRSTGHDNHIYVHSHPFCSSHVGSNGTNLADNALYS
ncbi:hypothetical protein DFJ77DRAFT_282450 [Powellomyces hirtus]|nr:hypothetical protein DFJ77DRAFT_282450 [Powellomyces hirtus]